MCLKKLNVQKKQQNKHKSERVYRKYVIFISMEVMKDAGNINVLWNNNQNAK